jgi:hypothetical protein
MTTFRQRGITLVPRNGYSLVGVIPREPTKMYFNDLYVGEVQDGTLFEDSIPSNVLYTSILFEKPVVAIFGELKESFSFKCLGKNWTVRNDVILPSESELLSKL